MPNLTMKEVSTYALARAMEFTSSVPSTESLMYRRIGLRQQQLFGRAAIVSPDYWGICATAGLDDSAADLSDMDDPIESAESVTKIDIVDPGSSDWDAGQEIRVVSLSDPDAELAPRATIRNRVIRGVGSDLDGVISIKIHYSRIPLPVAPTDGTRAADIPAPHDELLVVDLTMDLLAKTLGMDASLRTAALERLRAEENVLLAAFDLHVREYAGSLSSRFGARQFKPRTDP